MSIEAIIFWVLLVDSIGANFMAWFGSSWYLHHFRLMSRYFPLAKGWTAMYLVLVLVIGYLVYR